MLVIRARNVNDAFHEAMWKIQMHSTEEDSRNGKVTVCLTPVTTVYARPWERMLFSAARDANPFFHVMEAMWMLAGQNDVRTVEYFAKNMSTFSDDSYTLNGAYGRRWRYHFDHDQILWAIQELRANPTSRRVVIGMWDPLTDPEQVIQGSLDVPCNTHIYFRIRDGFLDMTVCCRSNDVVWGCYGANAVHMSFLQEFVAQALGIEMGTYYQVSNNWHIYEQHYPLLKPLIDEDDPYVLYNLRHTPLLFGANPQVFLDELPDLLLGVRSAKYEGFSSPYINEVLVPLVYTWRAYKAKDRVGATDMATTIGDGAVSLACLAWLNRRNWNG